MKKRTIPRNAPCPCGSGKKYKLCCLIKKQPGISDPLWKQLRQIDEKIVARLLPYARDTVGEEAIYEAWDEFVNYREDMLFDFDSSHNQAFFPWFLFNWQVEEWEEEEIGESEHEGAAVSTLAGSYMETHHRHLSERERRFIKLCLAADFSFHEVRQCQPGTGFVLKDIVLEREAFVTEHSASRSAEEGDILFAKVIQYDRIGLIAGCGGFFIPPLYKPQIIDLRASMRSKSGGITEKDLHEWSIEIRDLYFDIYDQMCTPPEFVNMDGDPFCLHELQFQISSPQVAFEGLIPLALGIQQDELLEDAESDDAGNLKKVEIPWRKKKKGQSRLPGGDYILAGNIVIEDTRMKVSVNSRNRAKKVRREIEKRLGDRVTYLSMEEKSVDMLTKETHDTPGKCSDPMKDPEMREVLDRIIGSHWESWIDENIPALGGITPRQAVQDKDGQEKVIALLDEFRRRDAHRGDGLSQIKYIQQVRKKLGLE